MWDEEIMNEVNELKQKIPRRNYGQGIWKEHLAAALKFMKQIDVHVMP